MHLAQVTSSSLTMVPCATRSQTIFNPSKGSPTATRTYQGKKDDVISTKEGAAIAKNIGASVPTGFVVAKTPPAAVRVREPVSYTTESKGSYQAPPEDGSRAIHTIPPRDVFLQKLEVRRSLPVPLTGAERSPN